VTVEDAAAPALASDARRVIVAATEADVDALRPQWEALRPWPGADPSIVLSVVRARPSVLSPHVFALVQGDEVEALLVARLEDRDHQCRFGYRTVYAPRVRTLTIDYGGALRARPDVAWTPLVASLVETLNAGVASVAHLRRIDVDSDLAEAVRRVAPRLSRNESEAPTPHWRLELGGSYDDLLSRARGRTRQMFARSRRVLHRAFGRVVVRKTVDPADVPAFCRRVEKVACGTYQRGLGAGFVHDVEYESRLSVVAAQGRLAAYELVGDDAVLAFWIGATADDTHYLDSTGFADEHRRLSPGKVLRMEVLRDLCATGVRTVDFGLGDAEYKRHFGATRTLERDVYLFAPGLAGAWLSGVRSGTTWAARCAEVFVRWARAHDSLRRATREAARRRLASSE